jgi:hypothetical protein
MEPRGSNFSNEPITDGYFTTMLRNAMKEPTDGKRLQQVRAVLGNFGVDVGLTISDTEAILTNGVSYAAHAIRDRHQRANA